MKRMLGLLVAAAFAPMSGAADLEAGKTKVSQVCAACHGANGVSVSDTIPNLAAQRAAYIEGQLKAFKEGTRRAAGPTSPSATKSAFLPNVAKTHVTFPEGYKESFVKYHTINFPAAKQVRYYYANKAAVQAAKAGHALPDGSYLFAEVYNAQLDADKNPVKGPDGFFVGEKLVAYTAMATGAGWGNEFPDMLRNGNWNYAVFSTEKQQRPVNQAECLGCHKPLDKASYVFTLKELAAAGK